MQHWRRATDIGLVVAADDSVMLETIGYPNANETGGSGGEQDIDGRSDPDRVENDCDARRLPECVWETARGQLSSPRRSASTYLLDAGLL